MQLLILGDVGGGARPRGDLDRWSDLMGAPWFVETGLWAELDAPEAKSLWECF